MATKEVKKQYRRRERNVDRISKLPDALINHILSYLPTLDAVRISILSKRWRLMWIYVPVLYLKQVKGDVPFQKMPKIRGNEFLEFVRNYLKYRHNLSMQYSADATSITSFKLDMQYNNIGPCKKQIDDWLSDAVEEGNVKELDLCIKPSDKMFQPHDNYAMRRYCLPQLVLDSRTLVILKLKELKLKNTFIVNLPSLKELSLDYVKFDEYKALQILISGCPILEDLCLRSLSLHRDLVISGTLRNLSLSLIQFTNQQHLQAMVSALPLLEKLSLCCHKERENISVQI